MLTISVLANEVTNSVLVFIGSALLAFWCIGLPMYLRRLDFEILRERIIGRCCGKY
jgi:hypothetical protein